MKTNGLPDVVKSINSYSFLLSFRSGSSNWVIATKELEL